MSHNLNLGNKSFNITYNISWMIYSYDEENGILGVYGMTAKESIPWLLGLYAHLANNRDKLLQYEPDNGWGSWVGTVDWVNRLIIAACEDDGSSVWEGD
jgi:hypothetical protein